MRWGSRLARETEGEKMSREKTLAVLEGKERPRVVRDVEKVTAVTKRERSPSLRNRLEAFGELPTIEKKVHIRPLGGTLSWDYSEGSRPHAWDLTIQS